MDDQNSIGKNEICAPGAQVLARSYKFDAAEFEIALDYVDALRPELQARVNTLTADEVLVLRSIKSKLNAGLAEDLKRKADTVGGFVW